MEEQMEQFQENKQYDNEPELITIDEKWISKDTFLKHELITCPVCYCIPLDYPKECQSCERIFCHTDYQIISNGDNRCPNCKAEPWSVKKDIHITYKHLFDSLLFKCILCPQNAPPTQYKTKQLIAHLQNSHNRYISDESILYDYTFVNDKNVEIKLNLTQNIEVNFKRNEGLLKFEIAGLAGRVLTVDLKDMTANHHLLGKCKIIKQRSKMIKKNNKYCLWIVNISDPDENQDRIVFYSEELQTLIEKHYEQFQKNERLNQFHLDVRETRYRISFVTRTQINTYTKMQKTIMRHPIIFR